ncbi:MAG TPA: hypothetical protein VF611_22235 [Pyrinomonadaceae bacterium]|jgi:hypothetical protein
MEIKKRLLLVQAAVAVDKAKGSGDLGRRVGDAAERALREGMQSDAWKEYMSLFADSAEQLKRLTTDELDGNNDYLPRARAYIVANAICAPGTDAATMKGLVGLGDIDADKPDNDPLDVEPDPKVAALRPFNVPEV